MREGGWHEAARHEVSQASLLLHEGALHELGAVPARGGASAAWGSGAVAPPVQSLRVVAYDASVAQGAKEAGIPRGGRGAGVKCPKCGAVESSVCDTRVCEGVRYRRRRCGCGERYSTKEVVSDWFPFPHKAKKVEKRPKKTPKVKKKPKKPKKKEPPALQFSGIPVTKDSPEWLKRVAVLIGE